MLSRCVPNFESVTDISVAVVRIRNPVDIPVVAVISLPGFSLDCALAAISIQVATLEKVVDMTATTTMSLLGFHLQIPIATVEGITNSNRRVYCTLCAVVNLEPVSEVLVVATVPTECVLPYTSFTEGRIKFIKSYSNVIYRVDKSCAEIIMHILHRRLNMTSKTNIVDSNAIVNLGLHFEG